MVGSQHYLVEIELKRVQTWLFEAPRLKAMVGANTLIGELLYADLPKLAADCGAAWPAGVTRATLSGSLHADAKYTDWWLQDPLKEFDRPLDPTATDAILIRDASRFWALFGTIDKARNFARESRAKIAQVTGGVTAAIVVVTLSLSTEGKWRRTSAESAGDPPATEVPLECSLLEPCRETGHGIAEHKARRGDGGVSRAVFRRISAESKQAHSHHDRVGLLQKSLSKIDDISVYWPSDFEGLAQGGYLAVVCADGNGVGAGREKSLGSKDDSADVFAGWVKTEEYFWRNRAALRGALHSALQALLRAEIADKSLKAGDALVAPCRVLMLGGDDLLVLCQARYAPQLASDLCAELAKLLPELTLGVGVAVVHPKFPFRRAHELAESLLDSAKKLHKTIDGNHSCIDWQVLTAAHLPDLAEQRKADWLRPSEVPKETAVLSCRPYTQAALARALQASKLLAGADGAKVGRGQWRDLVDQLMGPNGKTKAENWLTTAQGLPREKRKVDALKEALTLARTLGMPDNTIFRMVAGRASVYVTEFVDLVELAELPHLGTRAAEPAESDEYEDATEASATTESTAASTEAADV